MNDSLHIVCPYCDAVNRLSAARLEEGPRCGKCRQPLFYGGPAAVNGERLARHVARNDLPVLVDFWASWCGPCRQMAPAFEQAAARLEPRVRLLKVSTEEEQEAAMAHTIRSIPTLILFKGGREHDRLSGALDLAGLLAWTTARL